MELKLPLLHHGFDDDESLNLIYELVETHASEINAYSRYIQKEGNLATDLEAQILLPPDLRKRQGLNQSHKKIAKNISDGRVETIFDIKIGDLYKMLQREKPPKVLKKESTILAELLQALGFFVAPDVRLHSFNPSSNPQDTISLYYSPELESLELPQTPSDEYRLMTIILRLGCIVAHIDNDPAPSEKALLLSTIEENQNLTQTEKTSLSLLLHYLFVVPQGMAGIKGGLKGLDVETRTIISHVLICVAQADGKLEVSETKQLEKLYKLLELDHENISQDLHNLSLQAPSTDEILTQNKEEASPYSLNHELIKLRQAETAEVKSILEELFTEEEEMTSETNDETLEEEMSRDDGSINLLKLLEPNYQELYKQLITKESWTEEEFNELTGKYDMLPNGAMEVLNEWSYDNLNLPLIEEADLIYIDLEVVDQISDMNSPHEA